MQHQSHSFRLLAVAIAIAAFTSASVQAAEPPAAAIAVATQLEDAFAYVAEKARPAVVVITNIKYNEMQFPGELEHFILPPRWRQRQLPRRRQPIPMGTGSGAIISPDGFIVTNYHVIEGCKFLRVKLADGTVFDNQKHPDEVKIIGKDEESDLAVLQIGNDKRRNFSYLEFADVTRLRVGQWAIALGAPHGLEQSLTIGTVSQIGRHGMHLTTFENYIQTDAAINPGNSGGPLLNIHGKIIGINNFIHTDGMGKGNIGLGFAIAADLAQKVTRALIADGEVRRPFIGITMQELSPELKRQFQAENGIIVAEVLSGEAAEKAGIKQGDIITKLNGKLIKDTHDFLNSITNYLPGDTLTLTVLRDEKTLTVKVVAGKRELADNSSTKREQRPGSDSPSQLLAQLGLELEDVDGTVYIKAVSEDSAAANLQGVNQLRQGDAILEINRQPIGSMKDVTLALRKTKNNSVVMLIERPLRQQRQTRRFYIAIPLD